MNSLTLEQKRAIAKRNQMRYRVKTNDFVASNCDFSLESLTGHSYGWWNMVQVINGLVVFNWYSYSSSTSKHQRKVSNLLDDLGLKVDLRIDARKGLQDLDTAISDYQYEITQLVHEINKPRTHKAKNEERAERIKKIQAKIEHIQALKAGSLKAI